ncbi:M1 family metallopeptidase [Mucilaginibacter sp. BT774]|uniref:M1 family metallopeptidase n=1 Tax=Mucilaginibacter sp. BT774 TaxID=3062276 RepID=UPI0026765BDB|nr:M1 family metallopeptidase [Mucilaginibacter sp. BT774]MDO3627848.1 M1 family metallopeptidase [Mucilaginibacter sp. BT774]
MHLIKKTLSGIILLWATASFAQTSLPVPTNIQATYNKGTRTPTGAPGKNYWQNRAAYNLTINFTPKTRVLDGIDEVEYTNNSPDTLKQIWFKLYPNLYLKGNIRAMPIKPEDITDGVRINKIEINQTVYDTGKLIVNGTNMIIPNEVVSPKQKIHFKIYYTYTLNKTSHVRTGQVDTGAFFIAYFFPRIAVYDDIDGWNTNPYRGTEEFYNDFCNFKASIIVPGNYQVWATGNLTNPNQVYTDQYIKRIQEAEKSDNVTDIITEDDLKAGNISPRNLTNTWQFEADSVTDLAFAISDHYLWKASSLVVDPKTNRRTRVDAVFNQNHKDYFAVINYARKTVESMSYVFPKWPYPYPHETVFDGLDQMEYPMMVNDNPEEKVFDAITLTDHEIFHTMFPFYMGVNETKYGWMDEGWATIGEWVISPLIDPTIVDNFAIAPYENIAGKEGDQPIMTLTNQLGTSSFEPNSYGKPGLGYYYIRDLLGDELFTKALHHYIEQWQGKHPMPYDFFNCINTACGQNLNWFWRSWFFDRGAPDLAISKVTLQRSTYTVVITNIGGKPIPIDLTLYYGDGTTQLVHESINAWKGGNKTFTINHQSHKHINKMVLGTTYDPDINKENNGWEAK